MIAAEFVDMRVHRNEPPASAGAKARLVLSRLPRGHTVLSRGTMSLKFVLGGEERYEFDGRQSRVAAGQLLIVDGRSPGFVSLPADATGLCLYLPELASPARMAAELLLQGPVMLSAAGHPLGNLLAATARMLVRQPELGPVIAESVARRAVSRLSGLLAGADQQLGRLDTVRASTRRELVRRVEVARTWLHSHPHRVVPLSELAAQAHASPFHLARAFSALHGVPPAAYHRNLRLDAVAAELRRGMLSATEAAHRFGFADQAGFTRAFKRRHGVTPGEVRRRSGGAR